MNSIINPDKLGHLGPVGDVKSLVGNAARRDPTS
jgi:hypothetical protein